MLAGFLIYIDNKHINDYIIKMYKTVINNSELFVLYIVSVNNI